MCKPPSSPLLPVAEAVKAVFANRISRKTIYRWINKGCRGRKLNTHKVGGRQFTTVEAVKEFVAAQATATSADTSAAIGTASTIPRSRSKDREELLRSRGLI